MYYSFFIIYSV